jgi:PD-(D/E)XK nuclease superfamily protein
MTLPHPPKPAQLSKLSPSIYEALRVCRAKAAWLAFGERGALPGNSFAMLGLCFHKVAAAAQKGQLRAPNGNVMAAARQMFDAEADRRYAEAHKALKAKYSAKERLPFYYARREAAAVLARTICDDAVEAAPSAHRTPARLIEKSLQSKDGLLYGRPDLLNIGSGEVVDYKTRREASSETEVITEQERRQLHLYAHLAAESGWPIQRGVILLASGTKLEMEIDVHEAKREAQQARKELAAYNSALSKNTTFTDLANPSAENCRRCQCMVVCEPFWQKAEPDWREKTGIQVQGHLADTPSSSIPGTNFIALHLTETTGTADRGKEIVLEQMPEPWLLGPEEIRLEKGALIKIINARESASTEEKVILRADRADTEVWALPAPQ